MKFTKLRFAYFLCLLLGFALNAKAQFGLKIAQSRPMADFGANFSKAPTYEFLFFTKKYEGKLLSKLSLSYTNFKPRQDTIADYSVEFSNNGYKVYPGSLAFDELSYFGLSIDNQLRIFEKNGFELFAGLGLSIMKANYSYYRSYDTQIGGSVITKDIVVGGNVSALAMYNLNEHFAVFGDIQFQYATFTDWSTMFPNRKIGIGFLYTINADYDY